MTPTTSAISRLLAITLCVQPVRLALVVISRHRVRPPMGRSAKPV